MEKELTKVLTKLLHKQPLSLAELELLVKNHSITILLFDKQIIKYGNAWTTRCVLFPYTVNNFYINYETKLFICRPELPLRTKTTVFIIVSKKQWV